MSTSTRALQPVSPWIDLPERSPSSANGEEIWPGLAGDVEFYLDLARRSAAPVLELGCGSGRVAIPIARAGIPIVGLDRSPAYLALARRQSEGVAGVRWVEGNMRTFALTERFGLVIIPYRGFQYLLAEDDQRAALDAIRRHLLPGGRLALNVFNPDILTALARMGRRAAAPDRANGAGAAEKAWIGRTAGGPRLRYLRRAEMERLLVSSGFEVEALFGWFDGRPFDALSTEMVWIARKATGTQEPA